MEMENNLPKGWDNCSISTVCSIITGRRDVNEGNPEGKYPFFTCAQDISRIDNYEFEGQAILVAGNGFFNVKFYEGKFNAYQRTYILQDFKIASKYLYYNILAKLPEITKDNRGSTIRYIRLGDLADYEIPLPPLPEQHRIVAKLDALFEKIESNKQRSEKIPKILKRFRQSVLASAVSGKLTEDWREKNGVVEEWEETTLLNVITEKPKNGYSAKPVNYETPHRVLTLTATTSGKFIDGNFKYFDEKIDVDSKFWIKPGDILVQRGNTIEYVGVSAIYNGNPNEYIYPDLMMRFRANERILTNYLYFVLSDEKSRNYLRERATGTAGNMPKINQPTLISLPVKLPSLKEQTEIVHRVEQLFTFADKIETRYTKAKAMLDKLPQSILAKTFRGELVAQDPNDEPASVLLERIKAEKACLPKSKRRQEKLAAEKKGKKIKTYKVKSKKLNIAAEKEVDYES